MSKSYERSMDMFSYMFQALDIPREKKIVEVEKVTCEICETEVGCDIAIYSDDHIGWLCPHCALEGIAMDADKHPSHPDDKGGI